MGQARPRVRLLSRGKGGVLLRNYIIAGLLRLPKGLGNLWLGEEGGSQA